MATSFAAAVEGWCAETKARMVAVRNTAIDKTIGQMQTPVFEGGALPFKTGFLRSSLQFAVGDANFTLRDNPGGSFPYDKGGLTLTLVDADLGDPIKAVYTARYARRMEYGFVGTDSAGRSYNQPGRAFVRLAAQNWVRNVELAAAEVRTRVQGPGAASAYQTGG